LSFSQRLIRYHPKYKNMDTYMLLVRGNEFPTKNDDEFKTRMSKYGPWRQKMMDAGRYITGAPLEMASGWQLKVGGELKTDGPYMEAKEIVGGYILVHAEDMEDALSIARGCPLNGWHTLEVRKVNMPPA